MPEELQEIIAKIGKGSQPAFGKLVEMYQKPMYRLAFRILGDEEEAKDVVQECFIKIWRKIGTFDASRNFTTWMNAILVNTSADRLRAQKRNIVIPIDQVNQLSPAMHQPDHGVSGDNRDLALLIRFIAGGLPEKQKLVFILRDIEGMISEEVEAITGMSETSVKSNLYLARKFVREKLFMILKKETMIK